MRKRSGKRLIRFCAVAAACGGPLLGGRSARRPDGLDVENDPTGIGRPDGVLSVFVTQLGGHVDRRTSVLGFWACKGIASTDSSGTRTDRALGCGGPFVRRRILVGSCSLRRCIHVDEEPLLGALALDRAARCGDLLRMKFSSAGIRSAVPQISWSSCHQKPCSRSAL
jgi:hypothetical protein